jgi:hypothetical protein
MIFSKFELDFSQIIEKGLVQKNKLPVIVQCRSRVFVEKLHRLLDSRVGVSPRKKVDITQEDEPC